MTTAGHLDKVPGDLRDLKISLLITCFLQDHSVSLEKCLVGFFRLFVGGLVGWLVVVFFFYLEGITLVATILGDEQGKVVGWGGRGSDFQCQILIYTAVSPTPVSPPCCLVSSSA